LVEHATENRRVASSSLALGTLLQYDLIIGAKWSQLGAIVVISHRRVAIFQKSCAAYVRCAWLKAQPKVRADGGIESRCVTPMTGGAIRYSVNSYREEADIRGTLFKRYFKHGDPPCSTRNRPQDGKGDSRTREFGDDYLICNLQRRLNVKHYRSMSYKLRYKQGSNDALCY
jgi:hypothetical protein